MADESLHIPSDQNLDYHIVTLFERLEAIRKDNTGFGRNRNNLSSTIMQPKRSMHAEIRTLEFWRSIIAECLASFFYVFIVCGAAAGAGVGASVSSVLLATALASGFAIATLTQCFMHISGAHINPAVTLATCTIRAITPLRAAMYITAQCGGGIAGAALLYGVTVPGYQGNLQAAIAHSSALAAWERFGVEFILTFIVVLAYFVSMDSYKKYLGNASLAIGAAYSACSFVSMPYLNPARSLGPSFVLNKWDHHWVYWFGPMVGGAVSAIVYEYIFNSRRNLKKTKDNLENDSSSIHSEDDLNYDLDLEKPSSMQNPKFQGSTYRQPTGTLTQQAGYCQNFYTTTPMSKIEPSEPLYGGTRSLYCRSPPMPRANLNRSQSVYAKSNTAINRDVVPRPGPLVPAQSLYPMRLAQTQNSHLQNQNLQNQMQQRTESIYGIRGSTRQSSAGGGGGGSGSGGAGGVSQHQQQQQQPHPHHQQQQQHQQSQQPHSDNIGFQPVYGTRHNPTPHDGSVKFETRCNTLINSGTTSVDDSVLKYSTRSTRPESMYGTNGQRPRGQSAQSDDSSYGSYHGSAITPPSRNPSQTGGGGGGGVGGVSGAAVGGNMGEIIMYAPPSVQTVGNMGHQQQQQQQMRTCERKISSSGNGNCQTGVGVGGERQQQTVTYSTKLTQQMVGQNGGQLPPPPPHNQPPPPHTQPPTTQQQQQMQQQNQSAQYGMIPMRQN